MTTTLTASFCNKLAQESPSLYATFPQFLVDQASIGLPYFEVPREALEKDYLRLQIISPVYTTAQEVCVKLRLSGVVNVNTGKLNTMRPRRDMKPEEQYINFSSMYLSMVTPSDLITESEFNLLVEYCKFWEENEDKMWKEYGGRRISLMPANNFLAQFSLEIRLNPNTGKPSIGIDELRLRGFTFLNTFSPGTFSENIGVARKIKAVGEQTVMQPERGIITQ